MVTEPLLELCGLAKTYPGGTRALRGVDMSVAPGRVHGLVGANGAGKSTLIKILAGALPASGGELRWRGAPARWRNPADARRAGLATVYQHTPLVPTLSVLENVFLAERGDPLRERARRYTAFAGLLERVGYRAEPDRLVGDLPIGERQMVAILQALAAGGDLVIMDEPTAALATHERDLLFRTLRRLAGQGTAIVYISHFLDEITELTGHVSVLRDGRMVLDAETADVDERRLVAAIVGREQAAAGPSAEAPGRGRELLSVRNLRSPSGVRDVSFAVHAGEVVGLAGLLGSGRSEILHAVFGADRSASGRVGLDGRAVRGVADAVRHGLALVPEDRTAQGLHPAWEIWRNISLPHLARTARGRVFTDTAAERRRACRAFGDLSIKAPGPDTTVGELSGGNAQKVAFAKWIYGGARVFLLDEPTAGVDVGAKADIVALVRRLAADGAGVVVVSSEFAELLAVSDRVLVVRDGRIVAERAAAATGEHDLVALASARREVE